MELSFLGTSSATPTKERNVSASILKINQKKSLVLLDCGESTQHQLLKSTFSTSNIRLILITHLHGDHLFGLFGLLLSLGGMLAGKDATIKIVAPLGLKKILNTVFSVTQSFLAYQLELFEIVPKEKEEEIKKTMNQKKEEKNDNSENFTIDSSYIFKNKKGFYDIFVSKKYKFEDTVSIRAVEIDHKRIFSLGYIFEEDDYKGGLDPELLYDEYQIHFGKLSEEFKKTRNITSSFSFKDFFTKYAKNQLPKNFIKLLKSGKDVESINPENGEKRIIEAKRVLKEPKIGKKIIFLGDNYNPDPEGLLVKNYGKKDIDLLCTECTLENSMEKECEMKGHSCPSIVAKFCVALKPKKCIITHFSSRYSSDEEKEINTTILQKEVQKDGFQNVELAKEFKIFKI